MQSLEPRGGHEAARISLWSGWRCGGVACDGAGAAARADAARRRLMNSSANDSEAQTRYGAFLQELQQLGWTDGHNLRIDIRWGGMASDSDRYRKPAAELIALAPDVVLTTTGLTAAAVQRSRRIVLACPDRVVRLGC
jgi:putative ABC transport system substrate-binding protein